MKWIVLMAMASSLSAFAQSLGSGMSSGTGVASPSSSPNMGASATSAPSSFSTGTGSTMNTTPGMVNGPVPTGSDSATFPSSNNTTGSDIRGSGLSTSQDTSTLTPTNTAPSPLPQTNSPGAVDQSLINGSIQAEEDNSNYNSLPSDYTTTNPGTGSGTSTSPTGN